MIEYDLFGSVYDKIKINKHINKFISRTSVSEISKHNLTFNESRRLIPKTQDAQSIVVR